VPPPEYSFRYQPCVLWPFKDFDDHGMYTVGPPVDVMVRWQEVRREIRKPDGVLVSIEATALVPIPVVPNSLMWLGTVATLPAGGVTADNLKQVVTYDECPDVKGRLHRRQVTLARYNGGPPNLAT